MTARQEELAAGWLDGSLAEDEQAELLAALRADPALARAFAGEVEIHRGLQFSSSRSEEGDRRAADRILHYVRATHEGTRFAESVKERALAASRRHVLHPGTSRFGPVVAIAAVLMVAALVGLVALVGHRTRMAAARPEFAEAPPGAERVVPVPPAPGDERPAPPNPVEDEATRRKRIEEELRTAAGTKRASAPPKAEAPRPPAPEEKPVAAPAPKEGPPQKPESTRVDAPPALARLEGVQGDVLVGGDRTPAASGVELRDGATVETSGAQSAAVVRFADGSRVELSGEAKLHEKLAGRRVSGKGLTLARGTLRADVSKQPPGQAFLFTTPHAEVQVMGTRLSIWAGAETRVDVQEGQVRVTSQKSGQGVTLSAGQGGEVGPSGAPRSFLQGLHALYFDQNTFKGQTVERVEAGIDLFLDQAKNELPPVGSDHNFAVRWEGRFLAEVAGDYIFLLSVDGQVKLTLDGQDLVSEPRGVFHPILRHVVRRKIAAGWHDLVLEYSDDQGTSRCQMRYVPPGAKLPENDTLQADNSGFAIPPRLFSHHRR
jgi:hypothetical protein